MATMPNCENRRIEPEFRTLDSFRRDRASFYGVSRLYSDSATDWTTQ